MTPSAHHSWGKINPENSKYSMRQEISQFHSELGVTLLVAKEEGKRGPLGPLLLWGKLGSFSSSWGSWVYCA